MSRVIGFGAVPACCALYFRLTIPETPRFQFDVKRDVEQAAADAAYYILRKASSICTGNCFVDENVLKEEGITDLDNYAVTPGGKLYPDLFL